MADQSHLELLRQGLRAWNSWREQHPTIKPNLSEADLSSQAFSPYVEDISLLSGRNLSGALLTGADLSEADLSEADLSEADLSNADLTRANLDHANLSNADLSFADLSFADLSGRNLSKADFTGADLSFADLSGADLSKANLFSADLSGANLSGRNFSEANLIHANLSGADLSNASLFRANLSSADLSGADLSNASLYWAVLYWANLTEANLSGTDLSYSTLVQTNFKRATLEGCGIYGISAWRLNLEGTKQQNLNISDSGEPAVMVDNLEVAQFIYLLLNNEKIRDVIDTIGQKGVLILGRFTEERKAVLDAIRDRLRELGFVPMMFDFERATKRDFTETIKTLAGLSRFIIADITNPRSSPLELQATMPDYMIPFVPIIHEDEEPFAMFRDLQQKYGEWVLDVRKYDSAANLQERLYNAVVRPALDKSNQLILKKAEEIRTRHINEYH